MAMVSGIFTSQEIKNSDGTVTYDRAVDEDFYAEYMKGFYTDGIFPYPSNTFQVIADKNRTLKVMPGKALIKGRFCFNDDTTSLVVRSEDSGMSRKDCVVLRLDYIKREIVLDLKVGTSSTSPVMPELTRNSDIYELGIAEIYVRSGSGNVTQADITDTRWFKDLCGVVSPLTEVIDPDSFLTQLNKTFELWFGDVKSTLEEDTAGNLLNKINENKDDADRKIEDIQNRLADFKQDYTDLEALKKELLSVKMSGDFVNTSETTVVPFSKAADRSLTETQYAKLESTGEVRIKKKGIYVCSITAHMSAVVANNGPFHVGIFYNGDNMIGENYASRSRRRDFVSGSATGICILNENDVIRGYIANSDEGCHYRVSGKHTRLDVYPLAYL